MVEHGMRDVRLDERGWLWVARKGVLVYDGQDWHSFSVRLPSAHFTDTRLTYEDREGNIWVGLWGGGLVFCDPVSTRLYSEADGLPDGKVQCLNEDREGRIWIGTAGGLACLADDRLRPVATGQAVSALAVDLQGAIWSGGPSGQVCKGTGQETQVIQVAEGCHEEIAGLYPDRAGRVSVCTSEGGFGWIAEDRFTAFEERWSHPCRAVLQDGDGVLWIGTHGKRPALYCHMDGFFQACDLTELEAVSYVNALYEHEGTLWVGTAQGLFAVDDRAKQVRQFTVDQDGLSVNGILALAADGQGRLWVGTNGGGVLNYDGQTFHAIRLGKSVQMNTVEAILCDSEGRLWFGTRAGLIMYQPRDVPPGIVIRQVVEGRLLESSQAASYPEGTAEIAIHFQGIRFGIRAEPMRYSHRLVGYDPAAQWSAPSLDNKVSYNYLPSGEYRFEVRVQEREGLVSEVASLAVRVVADEQSKRRTWGILSQSAVIFEQAHGGTLFLDEIGDLPLEAQRVLLHILEEDHLTRVGGKKSIPVDVRVVAATHRDLRKAIEEGTFREDLFYRLSVFPVVLPPLRERREDIPLLTTHFVHQYAQQSQRPVPTLSDEVMAHLQEHTWPGNVRELAHRIERAVIVCAGGVLEVVDMLSAEGEEEALSLSASAPSVPLVEAEVGGDWGAREAAGAKAEKQQIEEALRATQGRIYGEHGAAQLLGMGPEKLRYYMRKYGVQRPKKS